MGVGHAPRSCTDGAAGVRVPRQGKHETRGQGDPGVTPVAVVTGNVVTGNVVTGMCGPAMRVRLLPLARVVRRDAATMWPSHSTGALCRPAGRRFSARRGRGPIALAEWARAHVPQAIRATVMAIEDPELTDSSCPARDVV